MDAGIPLTARSRSPRPAAMAGPPRERHVAAELGRECRRSRPRPVDAPDLAAPHKRGGRVARPAAETGPRRDRLHELDLEAPGLARLGGQQPRGADDEIRVVGRHVAPEDRGLRHEHPPAKPHGQPHVGSVERPQRQRIVEGDGHHQRLDLVEAVGPLRQHGEREVELRPCLERDHGRLPPVGDEGDGAQRERQADRHEHGEQDRDAAAGPQVVADHLRAVALLERAVPDGKGPFVVHPLGAFFEVLLARCRGFDGRRWPRTPGMMQRLIRTYRGPCPDARPLPRPMPHLLDAFDALPEWLAAQGQPAWRAKAIRRWLTASRADSFTAMTDLSKGLRGASEAEFRIWTTSIAKHTRADDGTEKLLLELHDGQRIECVLLRASRGQARRGPGRGAPCASVRRWAARWAACSVRAASTAWCETFTTGGVVEQLLRLQAELSRPTRRLSHIVVMGMGEPLANLDRLLPAARHGADPDGLGISHRRITISTVGLPPAIDRLAAELPVYNLAVSLHAADDALRPPGSCRWTSRSAWPR